MKCADTSLVLQSCLVPVAKRCKMNSFQQPIQVLNFQDHACTDKQAI